MARRGMNDSATDEMRLNESVGSREAGLAHAVVSIGHARDRLVSAMFRQP